jgi:Amt family ammonium transporter
MIVTGLFATMAVNPGGPNGFFYGNPHQLLVQLFAGGVVAAFAFVGSYILLRVFNVFSPLRVGPAEENAGLDVSEFGEETHDASPGEPTAPVTPSQDAG